jgi:hypothetical protein
MRMVFLLGITAGIVLCCIGTTVFKEARVIQERAAVIRGKTQQLNKEKDALSRFEENAPVPLETVYALWIKDVALLATMRKVSLVVEVKEAKVLSEEALLPGIKRSRLVLVFSGLRRWSDLTGVLAGIDDLVRMPERFPVVVDAVRQEKNVLFVEVSLFTTASGEKI